MCPYLIYEEDGTGVCSIRGLVLSPGKVSGYCEGEAHMECDAYHYSGYQDDDEYGFDDW